MTKQILHALRNATLPRSGRFGTLVQLALCAAVNPRTLMAVIFTVALVFVSGLFSYGIHYLARQDALALLASGDPVVEGSVDELVSTLARIKHYEQQLKIKSSQLDAAIFEAGELNDDALSLEVRDPQIAKKLGIGGGDNPRSPVISLHSNRKEINNRAGLLDHITNQTEALKSVPIGYPVAGTITSTFGHRSSPFGRRADFHSGLDIAIDRQSSVVAVADGIVVHASYKGAYGNMVLIDHGNGYETSYAHLSKTTVKVGERICRGEKLGFVGMTGRTTGPHLHFEIRKNGKAVNPAPFVQLAGLLKTL